MWSRDESKPRGALPGAPSELCAQSALPLRSALPLTTRSANWNFTEAGAIAMGAAPDMRQGGLCAAPPCSSFLLHPPNKKKPAVAAAPPPAPSLRLRAPGRLLAPLRVAARVRFWCWSERERPSSQWAHRDGALHRRLVGEEGPAVAMANDGAPAEARWRWHLQDLRRALPRTRFPDG